jgi:threonine synthase
MNLCEKCLSPLEVTYDYEAMKKVVTRESLSAGPVSMWRYKDLLPVDGDVIDLGTGYTPLVKAGNLGKELGLNRLYIKNDTVNPTFSFKDRPVSAATTKAKEFGFDSIACASTGNLAASVAAHAAKAKMKAYVFVPSNTESGKLVGAAIYGPVLVVVNGSYDDVNRLCATLAQKYTWGFININLRPYYAEGSKTLAYEVVEQLGWRAPDCVLHPAGSGLSFTRIWKGLNEFATLGLIPPVKTRMFAIQAKGSSPIVNAFESGANHINPVVPDTVAKSIAIGNPADGILALKIARDSGGGACAVTDAELIAAIKLLAQTEGIFAEATGGAIIASLKKLAAAGTIKKDELVVAYITGAGPRTQEVVSDVVKPFIVEPNLESFVKVLGDKI